jgi:transposase InsO family protein
VNDKYAFITAEYATTKAAGVADAPSIEHMCAWVGVSKSGYFEWKDRPPSAATRRRAMLMAKIRAIFAASDETYGYRRMHAELARAGVAASLELVRRLMRRLGLVPCQVRRPRSLTVQAADDVAAVPDLVRRDFTAARPYMKLIGDITEVKTWEGKLYLATVIDCFNKEVIGYAMADNFRTELVTAAIRMAAANHPLAPECIFHSDRGSNYTSWGYGEVLRELNLRQSLGRTGICFDNAAAESFFATLKKERVHRTVYPNRKRAMRDIARYIELFYNQSRLHTANGYRPPREARTVYLRLQEAA